MKFIKILLISTALPIFICLIGMNYSEHPLQDKIPGVCYGIFIDWQSPESKNYPSLNKIGEDISFISNFSKAIRTYGLKGPENEIPRLCQNAGLFCYPGAWLSRDREENRKEIEKLIEVGQQRFPTTKALVVGNEVLLRKDLSKADLINFIRQVKTGLSVSTAENWDVWLKNSDLVKEVDFILVHIHPYWAGTSIERAADFVKGKWQVLRKAFPKKKIVLGETGWPSAGQTIGSAVPSEKNQARFYSEILKMAKGNQMEYFLFEAFDESWKRKHEGEAGAHWGLFRSDRTIKSLMKTFHAE